MPLRDGWRAGLANFTQEQLQEAHTAISTGTGPLRLVCPDEVNELLAGIKDELQRRTSRPFPVTVTLDGPRAEPVLIQHDTTGNQITLTPSGARALADDLYAITDDED